MTRVVEKDGAYIIEMRIETEKEKNLMTDLLELDRYYKSVEETEKANKQENDLDASYDMSQSLEEENTIENTTPIQTQQTIDESDDWLNDAVAEDDKEDVVITEDLLPDDFIL